MATDKVRLFVRVSPEVHDRLKAKHRKAARIRESTGNRITFSTWIEEIFVGYLTGREQLFSWGKDITDFEDEL